MATWLGVLVMFATTKQSGQLIDGRSGLLLRDPPPSACTEIGLFPSRGRLTASLTQEISHHFTPAVQGPRQCRPAPGWQGGLWRGLWHEGRGAVTPRMTKDNWAA